MEHRSGPLIRGALSIGVVATAMVAMMLYLEHSTAGPSFCERCAIDLAVTENGLLTYRSGEQVELENRYRLRREMSREKDHMRVTGRITGGQLDRRLRGLVPGDHFDVTFDTGVGADACPVTVSPLYPAGVRRVLFLLPDNYPYTGKVWSENFCQKRLLCRYEVLDADDAGFHMRVDCGGNLPDGTVVALLLQARFDIDPGHYRSIEGDIRITTGPLDARWRLMERPRDTEASGGEAGER